MKRHLGSSYFFSYKQYTKDILVQVGYIPKTKTVEHTHCQTALQKFVPIHMKLTQYESI